MAILVEPAGWFNDRGDKLAAAIALVRELGNSTHGKAVCQKPLAGRYPDVVFATLIDSLLADLRAMAWNVSFLALPALLPVILRRSGVLCLSLQLPSFFELFLDAIHPGMFGAQRDNQSGMRRF